MKELLARLVQGEHLSEAQAEEAVGIIMRGEATAAQVGAFLTALRCNGESIEEIVGCARAMRAFASVVRCQRPLLVDTCGTGGDGAGTFNISTTAAFVVAGVGIAVAKHGNRAASSRSGSADVLQALGVHIELEPAAVARCLDEVGIGFLFAQRHHTAMRHVGPVRSELGFRTVFNVLGPLTNPAGAQVQVVGVGSAALVLPMAEALRRLGTRRSLVVHGCDGLDEVTLGGNTLVADTIRTGSDGLPVVYEITPEEAGLPRVSLTALAGGDPQVNAAITEAVLRGEPGPRRDVVCLNAAAALMAAGRVEDWREGVGLATRAIDGGAAWRKLEDLRRCSQREAHAL